MAFKASSVIPADQYDKAKRLAIAVKRQAASRSASFSTGGTAAEVLSALENLRAQRSQLAEIRSTPGIASYAQSQEDDPAYDVAGEFAALLATIDSAISWIVANMPKDGNGFLLVQSINADGSLSPRSFTPAQLATLVSLFDAIDAAVT